MFHKGFQQVNGMAIFFYPVRTDTPCLNPVHIYMNNPSVMVGDLSEGPGWFLRRKPEAAALSDEP
jgi:hypothetical protein